MKLITITLEQGNDFTGVLECEHCGKTERLTSGYHDTYYHTKVIPSIRCRSCGKDRAGETEKGGGE